MKMIILYSCIFPLFYIGLSYDAVAGLQDTMQIKRKHIKRMMIIPANTDSVFSFMDDISNTGMHMTQSNLPMMGSKLSVQWLTDHRTGLNSSYRWTGKVLGMKMDFTVKVSKWEKPNEKIWGTIGEAKMIVLDGYSMHLLLIPLDYHTTRSELEIHYTKRKRNFFGFLLARRYAIWCVNSMLRDTRKHFKGC